MAAAAGKKSTTSLSLFMEAYGLGVEEELSTMATLENGGTNKKSLGWGRFGRFGCGSS